MMLSNNMNMRNSTVLDLANLWFLACFRIFSVMDFTLTYLSTAQMTTPSSNSRKNRWVLGRLSNPVAEEA